MKTRRLEDVRVQEGEAAGRSRRKEVVISGEVWGEVGRKGLAGGEGR